MDLWLKILIGVGIFVVFFSVVIYPPWFSYMLYRVILVRTKKEKWGRAFDPNNEEEQRVMYDAGMEYRKSKLSFKKDVEITSCGFRLTGEYLDFGFHKAVIIISGRTEGCFYGYYFAEVYEQMGYNVLIIDNRCHGNSEGKYNTLGFKECEDVVNWSKMLHDTYHNDEVIYHGICIGGATALYACIRDDCPDYVKGMAAEGMYTSFADSFKQHMIEQKRPMWPFFQLTMLWMKIITGVDPYNGPINLMPRMKKPILLMHSTKDEFSLPEMSKKVYAKCTAPHELVWFDKGRHSRIRINNPEAYDETIRKFIRKYYEKENN